MVVGIGSRKKEESVVYNIPCGCNNYPYTGETHRKWETRRKEHHDKARLTKQDIDAGNIESATSQMDTNDGGLAKHTDRGVNHSKCSRQKVKKK